MSSSCTPIEEVSFIKMEGCSNDYIFIDTRLPQNQKNKRFQNSHQAFSTKEIQSLSHRHTGIGSDGLILIRESKKATLKMEMWNADGSPSKMCGNALRCLGLWEYQKSKKEKFMIESSTGLHETQIFEESSLQISIAMTPPCFSPKEIPFAGTIENKIGSLITSTLDLPILGKKTAYILSMGNPHCVIFLENQEYLDNIDIDRIGANLQKHKAFPEQVNLELASPLEKNKEELKIRTFERGSGETQACGSGACAVHVSSVLAKNFPKKQNIFLKGGKLEISWLSQKELLMKGSAKIVYQGTFSI